MAEKKKQKNGCCKELSDKVDVIYEILSAHKLEFESMEKHIKEMSGSLSKVRGRMGL